MSASKNCVDVPKLALVITELYVGGAEQCLAQLAKGLDLTRFRPLVISLAPRPPAGSDALVQQLEQSQIPLRFLRAKRSWQWPFALLQLMSVFRREQPDLIQTFLFHANVLGTIAGRLTGQSRIVTNIRVADPRWWRQCEKWTSRCAAKVCCVSKSVADHVVKSGFPACKIVVVGNGVDTQRFAPRNPMPASAAETNQVVNPTAVFVGRLDPQKGVDTLISAWAQLPSELHHCRLRIVGDGPDRSQLEAQILAAGVKSRIELLGKRSDVPDILRASQLMVLPSRWEGMSNALLEGMATGLPVIASHVHGVAEVLGDGTAQQSVPANDVSSLAQRIIELMSNSALRQQLGNSNRQRVCDQFSLAKMVETYQTLYDEIRECQNRKEQRRK